MLHTILAPFRRWHAIATSRRSNGATALAWTIPLLLSCCMFSAVAGAAGAVQPAPTPTATATNTPEPTATHTPVPTETPTPTHTPEPTATHTPEPTATNTPEPTPTNTPEPTATPVPPTATPKPKPTATPEPVAQCDANYAGACIPNVDYDLDCGDVSARRFRVVGRDVHRFDRDKDGIACES